ncbi:MAG: inositol monophosphatase [Chloroflexi bacterium]|nr:inositol monophosphatase [Chloroflexota bacterium]|tara:strand:+ start:342 stop:1151 length:810 start_codon:yes stop_codon:yes gene_type:complete
MLSKSGQTCLHTVIQVALDAGSVLRKKFTLDKTIKYKGLRDIVTDVDLLVEKKIRENLKEEFPEIGFVGEESVGKEDIDYKEGYKWIVDPIDGTRNFAAGIPFFSLVIGLSFNNKIILAVNYDPLRNEMFSVEKGKGAFLNKKKINVSTKNSLEQSIVGIDLSYDANGAINTIEPIIKMWPKIQTARIMGSAALGLSYVASGRTDLYFHYQLQPWDQVAGILLVNEAGGVVSDREGKKIKIFSNGIVAANKKIHMEFLEISRGLDFTKI